MGAYCLTQRKGGVNQHDHQPRRHVVLYGCPVQQLPDAHHLLSIEEVQPGQRWLATPHRGDCKEVSTDISVPPSFSSSTCALWDQVCFLSNSIFG